MRWAKATPYITLEGQSKTLEGQSKTLEGQSKTLKTI